jgi:GNAT superfamily N-acetyltransferase
MISNARRPNESDRSEAHRKHSGYIEVSFVDETDAFALRRIALAPAKPRTPPAYPTAVDQFHVAAFSDRIIVSAASFIVEDPDPEDTPMALPLRCWRIRAMATLPSLRRQGYASAILDHGINEIRNRRGVVVWCNGRVTAASFYEHHGFRQVGGIRHAANLPDHFRFVRELIDATIAPASSS